MRLEITQPLAPGGRRRITWAVKSALGISFTHDDYLLFLRVLSRNLLQQPEVAPEAVEAQAHAAAAAEQRRVAQSHHSPQQSLRRVSSGALRQPAPEQQEQPPFEVSVALPELCLRVQTQRMDGTYEVTASVLQVRIEWARGGRSVDTTLRRLRMAHCPTQHVMLDCRQHTAPQRQPRAPQRGARSRAKDDGEGHFFEFKSRAAASGETRMDIAMGLGHIAVLSARWFDLQDFLYNDVAIEAAGTLLGGGGPPPDPGVRAVRKVNMRLGELSLMLFEAARGVSELLHWSFYGVRVEFDQDGPDKVLHFAVTSSSAEDMEAAEGAPHACVLSVDQPDMPSPRITRAALSGADDSGLISFVYRGGAWARRTAEHITEEATRAGLRFAQEFIVHLGRIRFVYRHALWWSVMQSFTYGPFQQLLMLGYTRAQRLLYAAMWDPKLMGKFIIDWEEPLLVMPPASASASHLRLTLSAMHIENHSRVTSGPGGVPRFTDAMLVSLRDMDAVSDIDGERCPVIKGAQGLATIERDLVLKDGDPYNNRTSLEFEEGLSVDLTAGQLGLLRDLWALNLQVWPEPPPAPDSAAASTSEQPPKPAIQGSPGSQRLRFRCPVFRARLATDPAAVASWPQDGGLVFHIKSLDAGNWHDREAPGAWGQEVRCGEIELRDTAPVSEEFRYLFRLSGPEREGALQLTTETRVEHDGSHTADSSVLVGRLDAALTPDRLLQLAEFCTTRSICPQVHISRRERERAAPPGPPPPEVSATSRFEFAGLTFELPFEHLPLARLVLTRSEAQVDHYPGGKMEARGSIGRVELLDCTQLAGARPCIGTEDEMSLVRFFYTSDPAPPAPPHPLQLPPPQPAPESGPELQLFAPAEQGRLQTPQETPLATPLEAPLGAEGQQQQQGPESGALRRGSSLAALRPPALASLLPPRPKLPEYSQKANVHLSSIQLTVRQAFLTKLQGMLAQETMSTMTKLLELRRASEWVQHQAQRQMAEQQALLNLMVTVAHPRVLIPEIRPDGNEDNHLLLDLGEISLKNSLHDEAEAFYERFLLTVKEFNITCTGQGRTLQEVPLLSFPGDGFPPRPGEAADDGFVSMPTTAVLEELDDDEKCPLHIAAKRVLRHCHPLHSPTRDTVEWDSASVESLCPSSSLDRLDLATPSGTPVRFADPAAEAAPREPSAPREHESGAWPETPEEDLEWPMQGAQGEDGEGDLYEECGDLEEERQGEAPEGGDEDGEDLGRTLPQLESLSCFDYPPDLDVKVTLGKVKVVLQEFQWVQLMAIMQTNLAHSAAASDDADPFTPPTEPAAAAPPGSDDGGEIPSGADPAAESSEQDTTESSMRFRLSSEQIELDVDTFEPPADGADGPPTWTQRFTFSIHSFAGELAQCSATRRASLLLGTVRGSSARVRYEHEKGPAKALKVVGGRSTFGKRRVLQAPTKAGQQDEVPLIDVPQGCDRCLELAATVGPFSRKVSAVFSGPTLTVAPQLWLRLHDFFVLPVHQVLKVGPDSDDPVVIDRDTRLDRDLVLTPRRVLQVKAAHTQDCRLVANNFVVIDGQSHTLIFRRSKASAVPLIIIDDGVVLVIKQCVIHISGMKEPKQFDLEDFVLYKGPGSGLLVDPDKNMYGLQRSAANCLMSFNSATAWGSFNHSMIGLTPPAVDSHLSNVGEAEETDGKVATELRIRASMGIRLVDMWTAQQPALSRRRGSRAQPDRRTGALLCLVAGEAVLHRGTDSDGLVVTTSTISLDRFSVQREGVSRNAPSDMVDNVVCHVSLTSHSNNTEIGMVLGDVGVQLQYSDALLVSRVLQQLRQGTASDELMERKDQQQLQQAHQHHQHQQLQPAQNPAVQEAQKHAGRTFELTLQTRNCVVCLVDDSSRVHGTGVPLVSGRVTHVNFGLVRKRARRFKCTGNLVLEMNYFDKERMKWQRMLTPRELSARLERRGRGREGPELSLTVEAVCEAHISPALLRTAQRCSALSAEFAQAVAKGAAFVPQVKPTRLQNALCAPVKFTYDGMQSTCDRLTNKEFASTGATLHIELEDGNTFRVDTTKPGLMRPGWGLLVDVKDEEAAIIVSLKTDVVMHNELPCSFNLGNIGELPKGEAFAVQAELRESPLTLFPLEDKAEWSQVRQVSDNSAVCLSVDNLIMHHRSRPLQLKSESGDRAFHFCIHVERAGDCWGIYLRSPFRVVNLTGCLMKLCLLEHARVPHEFVRLEPGEVLHATAVPPWQRIALHGVLKQVPHQKSGEDGTRGPALQSCTKESKHFTVVRQRRIANRVPKGEPSLSSHLRLSENPSGPRGARGVEVWLDVSYSGEDVILSSPFWIINHTTQHLQVLPLVGHESDLETLPPTLARAGSEGPIAFGPLPRQGGQGGLRVKLKERTGKVSSPILMQTLLAEGIARFHEDQMFQIGYTTSFAGGVYGYRTRVLQLVPRWMFINRMKAVPLYIYVEWRDINSFTLEYDAPTPFYTAAPTTGNARDLRATVEVSRAGMEGVMAVKLPIDQVTEMVIPVHASVGTCFSRVTISRSMQTLYVTFSECTAPYQIANRTSEPIRFWQHNAVQPGDSLKRYGGQQLQQRAVQRSDIVVPSRHTLPFALADLLGHTALVVQAQGSVSAPIDLTTLLSARVHIVDDIWYELRPLGPTLEISVYSETLCGNASLLCKTPTEYRPINVKLLLSSLEVLLRGDGMEEVLRVTVVNTFFQWMRESSDTPEQTNLHIGELQVDDASPYRPGQGKRYMWPVVLHHRSSRGRQVRGEDFLTLEMKRLLLPSSGTVHIKQLMLSIAPVHLWFTDTFLWHVVRLKDAVNDALRVDSSTPTKAFTDDYHRQQAPGAAALAERKLQLDGVRISPLQLVLNVRRTQSVQDPYSESFGLGWVSDFIFSMRDYRVNLGQLERDTMGFDTPSRLMWRVLDYYKDQLRVNSVSIPGYISGIISNMFASERQPLGQILRIGDQVTTDLDAGLDVPAPHQPWRLEPGGRAIVVRVDSDGDPYLRSVITGHVSAVPFESRYVRIMHRPLLHLPPCQIRIDGFDESRPDKIEDAIRGRLAAEEGVTMREVVSVRAAPGNCVIEFDNPVAAARLLANPRGLGTYAARPLTFAYEAPEPLADPDGSPRRVANRAARTYRVIKDRSGQLGLELLKRHSVVHSVRPGGPAAEAEIRPGMHVIEVDGEEVSDSKSFARALASATSSREVIIACKPSPTFLLELPGHGYEGAEEIRQLDCYSLEQARALAAQELVDEDTMARWCSATSKLRVLTGASQANPVADRDGAREEQHSTMFYLRSTLEAAAGGGSGNSPSASAVGRFSPSAFALSKRRGSSASLYDAAGDTLSESGRSNCSQGPSAAPAGDRSAAPSPSPAADAQQRVSPVPSPAPAADAAPAAGAPNPLAPGAPAAGRAGRAESRSGQQWDGTQWHPARAAEHLQPGNECWYRVQGDWQRARITEVDRRTRTYHVALREHPLKPYGGKIWQVPFHEARERIATLDSECEGRVDDDPDDEPCSIQ